MNFDVYVSGPLSNLSDIEKEYTTVIYDAIESACRTKGLTPYLPSKAPANPNKFQPTNDLREHNRVYEIDRRRVITSSLTVAFVGMPSFGVGAEIEMARNADVPVVLLIEQGNKVSRLITGAPNIWSKVEFKSVDIRNTNQITDAAKKEIAKSISEALDESLSYFASKRNLEAAIEKKNWPLDVQVRLKEILDTGVLDSSKVAARRVVVSIDDWEKIESRLGNSLLP
jgi:hypothetical protein